MTDTLRFWILMVCYYAAPLAAFTFFLVFHQPSAWMATNFVGWVESEPWVRANVWVHR